MQINISQQLNLDPNTVANFFMNARRRRHDQCQDTDNENSNDSNHYNNNTPISSTSSSSCASFEILHSSPFSMSNINVNDCNSIRQSVILSNKQIYETYDKKQILYVTNYVPSTPQQQTITGGNCYSNVAIDLNKDIKPSCNESAKKQQQKYLITKLPKVENEQ